MVPIQNVLCPVDFSAATARQVAMQLKRRGFQAASIHDAEPGLPIAFVRTDALSGSLLVFRKHKADDKVLFIDASRDFEAIRSWACYVWRWSATTARPKVRKPSRLRSLSGCGDSFRSALTSWQPLAI